MPYVKMMEFWSWCSDRAYFAGRSRGCAQTCAFQCSDSSGIRPIGMTTISNIPIRPRHQCLVPTSVNMQRHSTSQHTTFMRSTLLPVFEAGRWSRHRIDDHKTYFSIVLLSGRWHLGAWSHSVPFRFLNIHYNGHRPWLSGEFGACAALEGLEEFDKYLFDRRLQQSNIPCISRVDHDRLTFQNGSRLLYNTFCLPASNAVKTLLLHVMVMRVTSRAWCDPGLASTDSSARLGLNNCG